MLSYEQVCEKLNDGPIHVKLDDGWVYYLTSFVPTSPNIFYGKFRLCKGSSEVRIHYESIVEIIE
jgi:hypothetical protein